MHTVGIVLHPERDSAEAVDAILGWAEKRSIHVLGINSEIKRLRCAATAVSAEELGRRSDLIVSLGGDGTMLRAMRLADQQRAPVLGVNLGKLGFLAEIDVPDLPEALSLVDSLEYMIEPRLAVDAVLGDKVMTAFNDIAVVRFPGEGSAGVAVLVDDQPFVSYAADAIVVATPTGSTAYSFSAGGPIVSPSVEALVVTPAAPHGAYNRGLVLSVNDTLALEILPGSNQLAIEVDGQVAVNVSEGDRVDLRPRPAAARVVRLGRTTFYERARRKLRLTDSAEVPLRGPAEDVRGARHRQPRVGEAQPVKPFGPEARPLDLRGGIAAEVVSAADPRPECGVEGALDPPQPWRGRLDVLEEPQLPAGPDDPAQLAQGRRLIGDRAQHQRGHARVEVGVGRREPVGRAVGDLDRDGRPGCCVGRDPAQVRVRLHGDHLRDLGRVMPEIEAVAGSQLDHAPG